MKILLLDIETAPMQVYAWSLWDHHTPIDRIIEPGFTLCYAAKWLGRKEILFDSVKRSKPDKMIDGIHRLLSEADAVCHYNGSKFDIPVLRGEFIQRGMTPPAPFKQIDLLKTMRTTGFPSKKLDYVTQQLGLGRKTRHKGMDLWRGCMAGDEACWRVMERYNRQDVRLLERLHNELRPWIKGYPNIGIFDGRQCCPTCGTNRVHSKGHYVTRARKYRQYQCQKCFAWLYLVNGNLQTGMQPYREAA